MTKVDYVVKERNTCLRVEVETAKVAKEIVQELIAERKRQGLTQQDIANRTGMKCPNVTRVESCKRIPTLDVLERYAGAVGKKLSFSLVEEQQRELEAKDAEINISKLKWSAIIALHFCI